MAQPCGLCEQSFLLSKVSFSALRNDCRIWRKSTYTPSADVGPAVTTFVSTYHTETSINSLPPVNNRFAKPYNVVMTPHIGANTAETGHGIAAMHIQTIEDAIAGRPLRGNIVNKEYLK